jgi:hypothetical protein
MTGPSRGTGVLRGSANVLVAPRSAAAARLSRMHLRPATADQRQQVTDLSTHILYAVLHEAVLNAVLAVISSHWHSAQVCMAAAVETAWHDGTQHLTGVRQLPERYKVSHEPCVCCRLTVLHAQSGTSMLRPTSLRNPSLRYYGLEWMRAQHWSQYIWMFTGCPTGSVRLPP